MGLKYTKMKAFHYKEKIDSLPRENPEILPPVHVRIKPTTVCAHSCWYCAYKVDDLQLGQDMVTRDSIPLEKMLEIIDDLDEMGVCALYELWVSLGVCHVHTLDAGYPEACPCLVLELFQYVQAAEQTFPCIRMGRLAELLLQLCVG